MARRICLWLPCLAVLALNACGGSETDFFGGNGSAGSSHAGSSAHAGSTSSSGSGNASSAGNSSTAGTTGVAGDVGSAGNSSTGGQGVGGSGNGNGGSPSSGGRAGANGSGGTGHAGSGGSGAAAGHAGAQPGTAGSGGTSPELSCSDLLKQASQQLEAARECNPNAKSIQCTGTVENTCGCEVPVQRDDSTETRAYLATLKKIDAKKCTTVCTAQVCKSVTDAECRSSGSDGGVCTAVSSGPGRGF